MSVDDLKSLKGALPSVTNAILDTDDIENMSTDQLFHLTEMMPNFKLVDKKLVFLRNTINTQSWKLGLFGGKVSQAINKRLSHRVADIFEVIDNHNAMTSENKLKRLEK